MGEIVVPASVNEPSQVPFSCLRPDVICTLKTTMTKITATETVAGTVSAETSQNMETGTLAESGHTYVMESMETAGSSPSSTGDGDSSAGSLIQDDSTRGLASGGESVTSQVATTCTAASPSTSSKEKPVFSYDPINTSTGQTETDDLASPMPTTSGSLDALSVLESALSAFTTTQGAFSISTVQSLGPTYFPLPTGASDTLSHTHEEQNDISTLQVTEPGRTTHASPVATTTTSSVTSFTSSNEEQAPHFTFQPTSDGEMPKVKTTSSTTHHTSQSGASLTYSPLESTSTAPSPPAISSTQTILAYGSLTVTAGAVSTISQVISVGGTTLTEGGAPVTLGQGDVLSHATDGLVVAKPSGVVQSMSTVTTPEQTVRETSGELPEVVQQPVPSDSSSETASAADAAGTGFANGSKGPLQSHGMALTVAVAFVILMI